MKRQFIDKVRWSHTFNTEFEADEYMNAQQHLEPLKQISTRTRTVKVDGAKKDMQVPVYCGIMSVKVFDPKFGNWTVSSKYEVIDALDLKDHNEYLKDHYEIESEKYGKWLSEQNAKKEKNVL